MCSGGAIISLKLYFTRSIIEYFAGQHHLTGISEYHYFDSIRCHSQPLRVNEEVCPKRRLPRLAVNFSVSSPTEVVSLGGPEEDQRVVLGLGGHDPLHQRQPALAARRAQ